MEKPILIMGSDDHARAVEAYMIGAGHPVHRFSSTDPVSVHGDDSHLALRIPDGFYCDEQSIKRMYWRTYDGVKNHAEHVVTHNRRSIFESWLKHIEQVASCWNGWNAWQMHQTKPYQHMLMKNVHGLRISRILPAVYGPVIQDMQMTRKCVQGGLMAEPPGSFLNTQAPFLHQETIRGDTFRVFVFAHEPGHCIAYRVISKRFDYRKDERPVIIREEICQELQMDLYDLLCWRGWMWSGIDLIYKGVGWV